MSVCVCIDTYVYIHNHPNTFPSFLPLNLHYVGVLMLFTVRN